MNDKNFFHRKKQKDGTIRVHYRKNGVHCYITAQSEAEFKRIKSKYNRKEKYAIVENTPIEIKKEKRAVVEVNPVDSFYNELYDSDYFLIEGFSIKLFEKSGDQLYLIDEKGESVKEIYPIQFFITNRKPLFLKERENIEYFFVKKLNTSYYLLIIVPKLFIKNNRIVFEEFGFRTKLSYYTAKRLYKKVDNVLFDRVKISLKDIRNKNNKKLKKLKVNKITSCKSYDLTKVYYPQERKEEEKEMLIKIKSKAFRKHSCFRIKQQNELKMSRGVRV